MSIAAEKQSSRNPAYDIARGIAMLCVVFAHTGYQIPGEMKRFAFSFHMPLFFLLSGYFFHPLPMGQCVRKTIRNYCVPYFLTCIFIILIHIGISLVQGVSPWPRTFRFLAAMLYGSGSRTDGPALWPTKFYAIGAIWFLLALAWGQIVLNAVLLGFRKAAGMAGEKQQTTGFQHIAVFGISYAAYYMSNHGVWLPLSLEAGLFAVGLIYLGYMARQAGTEGLRFPLPVYLVFLIIAVYMSLHGGKFLLVGNRSMDLPMDIIGSLSISFLVIRFSSWVSARLNGRGGLLGFIGKRTLPILCVHCCEAKFLKWTTQVPDYLNSIGIAPSWLLLCVLRCLVIAAGVAVLALIPGVNTLFRLKNQRRKE